MSRGSHFSVLPCFSPGMPNIRHDSPFRLLSVHSVFDLFDFIHRLTGDIPHTWAGVLTLCLNSVANKSIPQYETARCKSTIPTIEVLLNPIETMCHEIGPIQVNGNSLMSFVIQSDLQLCMVWQDISETEMLNMSQLR